MPVDVGRGVRAQALSGGEVGDPPRLPRRQVPGGHSLPQPRQPVAQLQRVADVTLAGLGGQPDRGRELRHRELRHQRGTRTGHRGPRRPRTHPRFRWYATPPRPPATPRDAAPPRPPPPANSSASARSATARCSRANTNTSAGASRSPTGTVVSAVASMTKFKQRPPTLRPRNRGCPPHCWANNFSARRKRPQPGADDHRVDPQAPQANRERPPQPEPNRNHHVRIRPAEGRTETRRGQGLLLRRVVPRVDQLGVDAEQLRRRDLSDHHAPTPSPRGSGRESQAGARLGRRTSRQPGRRGTLPAPAGGVRARGPVSAIRGGAFTAHDAGRGAAHCPRSRGPSRRGRQAGPLSPPGPVDHAQSAHSAVPACCVRYGRSSPAPPRPLHSRQAEPQAPSSPGTGPSAGVLPAAVRAPRVVATPARR